MKKVIKNASVLILLSSLLSCKKEVQIDLQSKESQIVIEADFAAEKNVNYVYLTKTTDVWQTNAFPEVSNANVVITDNKGYNEVLTEVQKGVYQTKSFPNNPGRSYILKVTFENKTFHAISNTPSLVKLDTMFATNSYFGSTKMRGFLPVYTDPHAVRNNYRYLQFINGRRIPGSILRNDEFTNGQKSRETIFDMDLVLKVGDIYEVEMQMIDDANYLYFSSKEKTVNLQSAAPANPVSNFNGGALGYFNVHATQYARMVITE
jgi:hypothetical protein